MDIVRESSLIMLTDSDFAYEHTPMVSPRVSPELERRRRSGDVGRRTWTLEEVRGGPFLCMVFPICTACTLGWVGGFNKGRLCKLEIKKNTYTLKIVIFELTPILDILVTFRN